MTPLLRHIDLDFALIFTGFSANATVQIADGITHIIPCNYSDKKPISIGYEHFITTVIKSLRQ